jgi:hypothetical protein
MRTASPKRKGNSGTSPARLSISVGRDSVEPGGSGPLSGQHLPPPRQSLGPPCNAFRNNAVSEPPCWPSAPNFFSLPQPFPRKLARSRRCGEMADATDLKSVFAKAKCGFESRHRQPLKNDFKRESGEFLGSGSCESSRMKTQQIAVYSSTAPRLHLSRLRMQSTARAGRRCFDFLNVRSRDSCDGLGCQKPKPRRNRGSRSAISLRPHSVFFRRRQEPSRTHASRRSATLVPVAGSNFSLLHCRQK